MVFEKIVEILEEELDVEKEDIKLDSKLKEDLGADSLDLFELISKLEEACEVTIDEEDYSKLVTVQNIIDYIENKKN